METESYGIKYWLTIPSRHRSSNVESTERLLGHKATWYVGEDDVEQYAANGANVSPTPTGALCENRNAAMDDAEERGLVCVCIDDDPIQFTRANDDQTARVTTFDDIVTLLIRRLYMTPFFMAGVASTPNPYFFHPNRRVGTAHFCDGFFQVFKPYSGLRNDDDMILKEDYDLTCQNIDRYGGVVRSNDALIKFRQRTNSGGCKDYRTMEYEEECTARLIAKWPDVFRLNPRRDEGKTQVLMNWKRPKIDLPKGLFTGED